MEDGGARRCVEPCKALLDETKKMVEIRNVLEIMIDQKVMALGKISINGKHFMHDTHNLSSNKLSSLHVYYMHVKVLIHMKVVYMCKVMYMFMLCIKSGMD